MSFSLSDSPSPYSSGHSYDTTPPTQALPLPRSRSVSELESRILGLKRSLQDDASRPRLTDEQAMERFQSAQLECQRVGEEIAGQKKALETISRMIDERNQSLHRLRISLGNRVTTHFSTILEARNFGVSGSSPSRDITLLHV